MNNTEEVTSESVNEQPPRQVCVKDLSIGRMRPDDVPGVMAIESVSFGKHHWADDSFLNEMNNQLGRYYALRERVVEHDTEGKQKVTENILGYCGYWLVLDEAHITTIAVEPNCRGNSLGEIQLLSMMDRMMGLTIHWLTLEVRVSNYSAQNLYYKYGFQSAGLRRNYYQDNSEDALIMTTPDILSKTYRALYNERKKMLLGRVGQFPKGFGQ